METVELSVTTPEAGWEFRVRQVWEMPSEVWVWAHLRRPEGPAAQMLSTVEAAVRVPTGKPRKVFVTGKTWKWENDEPYAFVSERPRPPPEAEPVPQPSADAPSDEPPPTKRTPDET